MRCKEKRPKNFVYTENVYTFAASTPKEYIMKRDLHFDGPVIIDRTDNLHPRYYVNGSEIRMVEYYKQYYNGRGK